MHCEKTNDCLCQMIHHPLSLPFLSSLICDRCLPSASLGHPISSCCFVDYISKVFSESLNATHFLGVLPQGISLCCKFIISTNSTSHDTTHNALPPIFPSHQGSPQNAQFILTRMAAWMSVGPIFWTTVCAFFLCHTNTVSLFTDSMSVYESIYSIT